MKDFKVLRWFSSLIIAVVVILCTGMATAQATTQKPSDAAPVSKDTPNENSLLQFSSGGHILGFKPDRVYFASFDHAIVEEFVGTKGVMPAANSSQQKGLTPGFTNSRRLPTEGVQANEPEAGKENPDGKKGAPTLGKVVYKNLWQGITLQYEAKNGGIAESTYALEPEADVKNIKLKYNVPAGIEKDGSLRFRHPSENGYFSQSAPKAWQEIDGKRTHVEVAFADYGDNTIGFRLGEYDRQYPVVIDPTYQWHTFYGSVAGIDAGYAIAVDTGGNVYVTGSSNATWNGPGATAPLNAYSGSTDIVVLKLNTSGAYQWHTFYGSVAGLDYGYAIAVDTGGNVYVTGSSNATWNGPGATAPLNAYSGSYDIVVLKLNTSGVYQWHTFYGSVAGLDYGYGITVDTGGNVYVTGKSFATWNGPGAVAPLNAYSASYDIVVLKLNTSGVYQWHTFYGSAANNDSGTGIAVDTGGNVYVIGGSSNVTWNGPAAQAPLNAYSGGDNIVVLKLNTNGGYLWHTFYGSVANTDAGTGIAVDTGGNVYVTGWIAATWNGPGATAPLNAYSGSIDIMVLKLNTSGAYQWHTFYGSASGYGIAVDSGGNVYVTGYSSATWNGPGATAPLNAYSGGFEIVGLKLNTSGAYQWHTFYGSIAGLDRGNAIAVDTGGNVYVTGYSTATWSGPGAAAPLNAYSGSNDIVILKLGADTYTVTANANGTGAGTVASDVGGINYTYQQTSTGTTTGIASGGVVITATGTNSTTTWGGTCTTAGGVEAGNGTGTATCTFASLTANQTVTATFTLNTYTLTVTKSGTGTGTVTGNRGAINCGATCSDTYNAGDVVTLTATPDAGSTFAWLDGVCFGTGTCVLTMNSALAPDAIFTLNTYTVTPSAGTGGTISPAQAQTVNYNATTVFTVTPDAGYSLSSVTGCGGSLAGNTYTTGAITATCTVTATFTLNAPTTYAVTATAGAGGSISPTSATVNSGSTTSFTVMPDAGYSISSVTGCNGTLSGNTYTTGTITANCTVTASFSANPVNGACGSSSGGTFATAPTGNLCATGTASAISGPLTSTWTWTCNGANGGTNASCSASLQSYTVTPSAGAGGTISPSTPQTVNYNATISFTITPDTGYRIDTLTTDCGGTAGGTSAGGTYTTGPITANCTVTATFIINTFTVTPSAGAGGSISPATPQTVIYNTTTAFTVTPDTGYNIASVTGCNGTLTGSTYTTGPITADCTVSAAFKTTFTITTPSGPIELAPGGSFVISTAGASNVVVDGVSIGAVNVVTFINITGPHTITW